MSTSVDAVVARALGICALLPPVDVARVAGWVDDTAGPTLHRLAVESARGELAQADAALGRAREFLDQALHAIGRAVSEVEAYGQRHASGATPSEPGTVVPTADALTGTGSRRISNQQRSDRVDAARTVLTEAVPGGRTVGVWVDERGTAHELVSGNRGRWHQEAAEFARARGWVKGRAVLGLTRHVEVQFAMRMRARHHPDAPPPHETIVLDRAPCGEDMDRPVSCKTHLPDFLPPGATLTVIERDGTRYTYQGRDDP